MPKKQSLAEIQEKLQELREASDKLALQRYKMEREEKGFSVRLQRVIKMETDLARKQEKFDMETKRQEDTIRIWQQQLRLKEQDLESREEAVKIERERLKQWEESMIQEKDLIESAQKSISVKDEDLSMQKLQLSTMKKQILETSDQVKKDLETSRQRIKEEQLAASKIIEAQKTYARSDIGKLEEELTEKREIYKNDIEASLDRISRMNLKLLESSMELEKREDLLKMESETHARRVNTHHDYLNMSLSELERRKSDVTMREYQLKRFEDSVLRDSHLLNSKFSRPSLEYL